MTIISFVSAKGGVGKTTIVSNLGIVLAKEFNKSVLIVDGNITTPTLGLHFGIIPKNNTLIEVLKNEIPITEAIYMHPSGVNILPASLVPGDYYPDPELMESKIKELKEKYDFILIDGAAGIGREVLSAIEASDEVCVVSNTELAAAVPALKIIKIIEKMQIPIKGMILNRILNSKYEMSIVELEELWNKKVICTVPFDNFVLESISKQNPASLSEKNFKASKSFMKLASIICGEEPKEENMLDKIKKILRMK